MSETTLVLVTEEEPVMLEPIPETPETPEPVEAASAALQGHWLVDPVRWPNAWTSAINARLDGFGVQEQDRLLMGGVELLRRDLAEVRRRVRRGERWQAWRLAWERLQAHRKRVEELQGRHDVLKAGAGAIAVSGQDAARTLRLARDMLDQVENLEQFAGPPLVDAERRARVAAGKALLDAVDAFRVGQVRAARQDAAEAEGEIHRVLQGQLSRLLVNRVLEGVAMREDLALSAKQLPERPDRD